MLFLTYRLSVHVLAFKLKKIISCILVFLLVLFLSQQHLNRDFTLTMVDVGQGDAFVIQDHQNKKTVLLDTGGTYQHNENRINLSDKRSEEHTSELQSRFDLVCRLLLEKKKRIR